MRGATPVYREVLTVDQLRNKERIEAYEKCKAEARQLMEQRK